MLAKILFHAILNGIITVTAVTLARIAYSNGRIQSGAWIIIVAIALAYINGLWSASDY